MPKTTKEAGEREEEEGGGGGNDEEEHPRSLHLFFACLVCHFFICFFLSRSHSLFTVGDFEGPALEHLQGVVALDVVALVQHVVQVAGGRKLGTHDQLVICWPASTADRKKYK